MKKILLIDANNILHRAFHAIPPMVSQSGIPTNALRGLANSILNLKTQTKADQIICAFDSQERINKLKDRGWKTPSPKIKKLEPDPEIGF